MKNIKVLPKLVAIIAIAIITIFVFSADNYATITQTKEEGFENLNESKYPGYKEKLRAIQKEHPNWIFTILHTGLDWDDVIFNETVACHSNNLVDGAEGGVGTGEWICPICGEKIYQAPGWMCTSKVGVAYQMDPRNFLNTENIFQFEALSYVDGVYTVEGIEKILDGSYMHNITIRDFYKETFPDNEFSDKKFSEVIMEIAKKIGVSPYHIATRLVQSNIAMTGDSSIPMDAVKGNIEGFEGLFNYFNISSKNNGVYAREKGLYKAQEENWTTPEISLEEGANYLTQNYIQRGQDTLYFQKFDVIDNEIDGLYWHQYMQNVHGSVLEGEKAYDTVYNNDMMDSTFNFIIPVYENMPTETKKPNQNEKIEVTKIDGYFLDATYYNTKERTELLNDINGKVITTLDKGAKISVINPLNEQWAKVMLYDGTQGYIKFDTIDFNDKYYGEFAEVTKDKRLYAEPEKRELNIVQAGEILSILEKNVYTDEKGNSWDKVETAEGIVAYFIDSNLETIEREYDVQVSIDNTNITNAESIIDVLPLTQEEKQLIENDKQEGSVSVGVKAKELINVTNEEKALVETVRNGADVKYYDIIMDMYVFDKDSLKEKRRVSETSNFIVKLKLPNEIVSNEKEYKIARIHEGQVDVLDASLNENGELIFETNKFSTYAVMYKDIAKKDETNTENKLEDNNTAENNVKKENSNSKTTAQAESKKDTAISTKNPKTGDVIQGYIGMMIFATLGIVFIAVIRSKRK